MLLPMDQGAVGRSLWIRGPLVAPYGSGGRWSLPMDQGAVAITVGSVLRGTILNYVICIGHYRGQRIQQPIKMTLFRIVPRTTMINLSAEV